jgi:hypothetical protein
MKIERCICVNAMPETTPGTIDLDLEDGEYVLGTNPTDTSDGKPLWYFKYQNKQIICDRIVGGKPSPFRGPINFILRSNTWGEGCRYRVVPFHEAGPNEEGSIFSVLMRLISTHKV